MNGNIFYDYAIKNISPHPLRRRMGGSTIDWTVHWTVPLSLNFVQITGGLVFSGFRQSIKRQVHAESSPVFTE